MNRFLAIDITDTDLCVLSAPPSASLSSALTLSYLLLAFPVSFHGAWPHLNEAILLRPTLPYADKAASVPTGGERVVLAKELLNASVFARVHVCECRDHFAGN